MVSRTVSLMTAQELAQIAEAAGMPGASGAELVARVRTLRLIHDAFADANHPDTEARHAEFARDPFAPGAYSRYMHQE